MRKLRMAVVMGLVGVGLAACSSAGTASAPPAPNAVPGPRVIVMSPVTGKVIWSGPSQGHRVIVMSPVTGKVIWSNLSPTPHEVLMNPATGEVVGRS